MSPNYDPFMDAIWDLPIMRSTREIGVLEMELQDYEEDNVTDVWEPLPFSTILPSPLFHSLWDMITNDKWISLEIWDQFVGGDVPSITFWRLSSLPPLSLLSFYFQTYLYYHQHDYTTDHFLVIMLILSHQQQLTLPLSFIIMLTLICHSCLLL